jgi:hypothetical protein
MSKNSAVVVLCVLVTLGFDAFLQKTDSNIDAGGLTIAYFILMYWFGRKLNDDKPTEPPKSAD